MCLLFFVNCLLIGFYDPCSKQIIRGVFTRRRRCSLRLDMGVVSRYTRHNLCAWFHGVEGVAYRSYGHGGECY